MSGYIGNIPVPQATQTRDTFTATAGQTTFATSGYTPSFLDVFLNGVHLVNGTDYTATNGSDVVLTSGAAAGDTLEVVSYSTFEVNSQTFTGTTTLTGDLQATTATFSGAVTGTDATLSGGVYLGGTGAANYLDDYEEGTWTPNSSGSGVTLTVNHASYTKVGRMVHLKAYFLVAANSSGTNIRVGGIPFTNFDSAGWCPALLTTNNGSLTDTRFIRARANEASLDVGTAEGDVSSSWSQFSNSWMIFSLTYTTT